MIIAWIFRWRVSGEGTARSLEVILTMRRVIPLWGWITRLHMRSLSWGVHPSITLEVAWSQVSIVRSHHQVMLVGVTILLNDHAVCFWAVLGMSC